MIGIVILAHGPLSAAFRDALEHVLGPQSGIEAISVDPEDSPSLTRQSLNTAMKTVDQGAGVIVVTDLYGSTAANYGLKACAREDRRLLYGANLPMLIKLAKARHLSLDEACDRALRAGQSYMDRAGQTVAFNRAG
ncbi:PTS sugar transporter subunit IIA [Paracoccaceae bacterium GXU_MW_L88]